MDTSPVFKSTWTLATFLTRSTERRMLKAQPGHVMPRTSIDASALTFLWAWVGSGWPELAQPPSKPDIASVVAKNITL